MLIWNNSRCVAIFVPGGFRSEGRTVPSWGLAAWCQDPEKGKPRFAVGAPPKLPPPASSSQKALEEDEAAPFCGPLLAGTPLIHPFSVVPSASASIQWVSAAEGNLSAPELFNFLLLLIFLVERRVTIDFGNGRATYWDSFNLKKKGFKNSLKCNCHLFSTKNFLRIFKTRITILSLPLCSPLPGVFQNESTRERVELTGVQHAWHQHCALADGMETQHQAVWWSPGASSSTCQSHCH